MAKRFQHDTLKKQGAMATPMFKTTRYARRSAIFIIFALLATCGLTQLVMPRPAHAAVRQGDIDAARETGNELKTWFEHILPSPPKSVAVFHVAVSENLPPSFFPKKMLITNANNGSKGINAILVIILITISADQFHLYKSYLGFYI